MGVSHLEVRGQLMEIILLSTSVDSEDRTLVLSLYLVLSK